MKHQKEDPFLILAKKEGYLARSVYKLKEIDQKFNLIKPGLKVIDFGASPGSWSQYVLEKIGKRGTVLAVDKEELKIKDKPENLIFLKADILKLDTKEIKSKFGLFDLVLSDAAPNTTGIPDLDSAKSLELAKKVLEIAKEILKPKGNLVIKIFEGKETEKFVKSLKEIFIRVKKFKPQATKKGSKEVYLVCINYIK